MAEQLRQGKTLEDARAGGCSGCVETGAFGKEAYILTGYFNLPKVLELALHDGVDPRTRQAARARDRQPSALADFDDLSGLRAQLRHFVDVKIAGNQLIERMYAAQMPAPFLSVLIDDCIAKGKDYNAGGARYNNTLHPVRGHRHADRRLAAIRAMVFDGAGATVSARRRCCVARPGRRLRRQRDAAASAWSTRRPSTATTTTRPTTSWCASSTPLRGASTGGPTSTGGAYRMEMLPTTCHVYFGSVTGATPDGRRAGMPLSEGISPVQGADRRGPTAVVRSAAKMDHVKTGGTLLNMKFTPAAAGRATTGIDQLAHLVRTLLQDGRPPRAVQRRPGRNAARGAGRPEAHRDLIVRVAGYCDYFCDLGAALQDEIIARTEHGEV